MEYDLKILEPQNPEELFILHYVYTEVIRSDLERWRQAWNNHTVATKGAGIPSERFHESCPDWLDDDTFYTEGHEAYAVETERAQAERKPKIGIVRCVPLATARARAGARARGESESEKRERWRE